MKILWIILISCIALVLLGIIATFSTRELEKEFDFDLDIIRKICSVVMIVSGIVGIVTGCIGLIWVVIIAF